MKTTNAPRCCVPLWRDHTIGPKTVENGDNYSTAPKRNMRRSDRGNLVQWMICRMRGGLVLHTIITPTALYLPLLRGAAVGRAPTTSKWLLLYQNLQFFSISNFFGCSQGVYFPPNTGDGEWFFGFYSNKQTNKQMLEQPFSLKHTSIWQSLYRGLNWIIKTRLRQQQQQQQQQHITLLIWLYQQVSNLFSSVYILP